MKQNPRNSVDKEKAFDAGPSDISFREACSRLGIDLERLIDHVEWCGFNVSMPADCVKCGTDGPSRAENGEWTASVSDLRALAFGASGEVRYSGISKQSGREVELIFMARNLPSAHLSPDQFSEIERTVATRGEHVRGITPDKTRAQDQTLNTLIEKVREIRKTDGGAVLRNV